VFNAIVLHSIEMIGSSVIHVTEEKMILSCKTCI
jgi:hypothetical protein